MFNIKSAVMKFSTELIRSRKGQLMILFIAFIDLLYTAYIVESAILDGSNNWPGLILISPFGNIFPFSEGRSAYIVPVLVLLTSVGINFRTKRIYCLSLFLGILAIIKLIEGDIRFFIVWYPYSNNLINAFQDHILYHLREYGVFFVFCKFQILRHIVVILLICKILHFLITKDPSTNQTYKK